MLTTADWLLGSNSQSAAGLSTLSDTMKGQYLVLSLTQVRERTTYFTHKEFNLYCFKSPKKTVFISCKIIKLPQLLCLSFRNSLVFAVIVVVFCFKHGLTPTGFESIVNEWSDCELAYCAFCFHLDVPCCFLNTVVIVCSVTWVCASLCMHLTTIFSSVCSKGLPLDNMCFCTERS